MTTDAIHDPGLGGSCLRKEKVATNDNIGTIDKLEYGLQIKQ